MKKKKPKTIKDYAQRLLLEADFVDAYGRNVGFDYETILRMIKAEFPEARTTKQALRYVLYTIDPKLRLPARHRSRRVLGREYARSLLLKKWSYQKIQAETHKKFSDAPYITTATLRSFEEALRRERITVPKRK